MKRILVTGAGGSAGINFIHCLRMACDDFYIIGSDTNKWHLELPDIDASYIVPRCTDDEYLYALNRIIEKERIDIIHSQPDTEVRVLSENREKINARNFLPSKRTVEICQDKLCVNEILRKSEIPAPEGRLVNSSTALTEVVNVLQRKHEKVWLRARRGAGARASLPIVNERQGVMWIEYWQKMAGIGYGDFMASEFLPGREFAFQSIWEEGQLVTSAARERLEYIFGELTPSGQSSSPSVARVVHRSDVNDIATKAILTIDEKANGIFCVDLKENTQGIPCVTEINAGRFFTTTTFFSSLGVNMPLIYTRLAFGDEVPPLPRYDAAPEGFFWIRLMDKGPILVSEDSWRSKIA